MFSITDIEILQQQHPAARFFIHNGYNGWSYGSPMNPTAVTHETAVRLLNFLCRTQTEGELRRQLEDESSAIQYAEESTPLYRATRDNRFLAFIASTVCTYRDVVADAPIAPPAKLTPVDIRLPDQCA